MFEDIELKLVVVSIVLVVILLLALVAVHVKSKEEPELKVVKYFLIPLMGIAIVMPFYSADTKHNTTLQNTKFYNEGVPMKCFGGFTPYIISKESGWSIRGKSFVKEDFVADMTRCFMLEEYE